jgi:thiol-disulfide isomerase/thioredoxin
MRLAFFLILLLMIALPAFAQRAKENKIVLIFEKTSNPPTTLRGVYNNLDPEKLKQMRVIEAIRDNSINFTVLNEFNDEENFPVNNYEKNDTFSISASTIYLDAYPGYQTYHFELGDTAYFTYAPSTALPAYAKNVYSYPNEIVYCSIKNRQPAKYDQAYMLLKRALDGIYFFEPDEKKFQRHNAVLDSLKKEGSVSNENYNLYRNMLRYEYLGRFQRNKELFNKYFAANDLQKDELLGIMYYRNFLKNYVAQEVMKGNTIKISNGISVDFKKAYDSIHQKFSGNVRDYLLVSCVKGIKSIEPATVYKTYSDRLVKDINNDAFTKYFTDTYATKPTTPGTNTALTTIGNKKTLDLREVVAKEKGKVVYVDLWASWCVPCRAAMPASEKLRNELQDKVSFVYLSIDEKYVAWEIAARAEKLLDYPNNYLLTDPKRAALIKELNLESIPRYLIYNKTGELVNQNAPGPQDGEARRLLTKYASE